MTLWFRDPKLQDKFLRLCRKHNAHGTMKKEGDRVCVVVNVKGKEHRKLLSAWIDMTIEIIDRDKNQKKFGFADEPGFKKL